MGGEEGYNSDDFLAAKMLSQFLHSGVIQEVERRKAAKTLPAESLELYSFQWIQIPSWESGGARNIIELNEEVKVHAEVKVRRTVKAGQPLTLDDVYPEEAVIKPPVVDGKPRAFALYNTAVFGYKLTFNFGPNHRDYNPADDSGIKHDLEGFVRTKQFVEAVKPREKLHLLKDSNWPPAPGYFPSVLLAVHNDPSIISNSAFVAEIKKAYSQDFWDRRISLWQSAKVFPNRTQYLIRAIKAHLEGDFIASIYVLLPQFQGIVNDYLKECGAPCPENDFKAAVLALQKLIESRTLILTSRELVAIFVEFLRDGSFWKHSSTIPQPSELINRHGVLHGAFVNFESEILSAKYLCLLDGLSYLILNDRIIRGGL